MISKLKKTHWMIMIALMMIGAGLIWTVATAILISAYTDEDSTRVSDAAIILGAAIVGEVPSPVFRERIEHAIGLYQKEQVHHLIFTGGSGGEGQHTEAEVGRNYAITHGVDPDDIRVETTSKITEENLVESRRVGEQAGYQTYTIVSDPLHMKRAMKLAIGLGMDAVPSPTQTTAYRTWRTKLPFLVRETVMYMGYTIKGWIDNPH